MNTLEWRPVVGWEGIYDVSNAGHVKRVLRSKGARAGNCLSPAWSKRRQYYFVILCRNGRTVTRDAHSLVAEAFIGPRPDGHEVNHKDGNKRNNVVSNLEYVTKSENAKHAVSMGLHRWSRQRELLALVEAEAATCAHCRELLARLSGKSEAA